MCGIVGIISRNAIGPEHFAPIRTANRAMSHRGPDGAGEHIGATDHNGNDIHLFMAMRRLSIIDLQGGWQPLYNEDKSLALICNGEIYNFVELRQTLEGNGHIYRSKSDCEAILHLYEQHGLDFVHHLRGMFAFALWDGRQRRLVLGRDRMGEKPLYVYAEPGRLLFASEMKVLLATGMIPFVLDAPAVHSYMHYGWVPEPATMIKGVRKLPAAHLLVIEVDTWDIREHRYWHLLDADRVSRNPATAVREELERVASIIMRSDVPVGVALSGGVDSSLVAALAAKYNTSVHAFSVGYVGRPAQDERGLARTLANRLRLPFSEIEISTDEMAAEYPHVCFLRDDPIADIAGYGYLALAKHAKERGCPVLLQGQGGDELFWGYAWSTRAVHHSDRKAAGRPTGPFAALLSELPRGVGRPQLIKLAQLSSGLAVGWRQLAPGNDSPAQRLVLYDLFDGYQIAAHSLSMAYTPEFFEKVRGYDPGHFFDRRMTEHRTDLQIIDLLCAGYLRENGLAQGDRLSMGSSIEVRLPLVDYRLVELVIGLQKANSAYELAPKQWLRESARDLLPQEIFSRPKRGFNPPASVWINALRQRHGRQLSQGYLASHGVLRVDAGTKLAQKGTRLSYVANDLFLKFLTLEFWCRAMSGMAVRPRLHEGIERLPDHYAPRREAATESPELVPAP